VIEVASKAQLLCEVTTALAATLSETDALARLPPDVSDLAKVRGSDGG
jgi:hypothetical protein